MIKIRCLSFAAVVGFALLAGCNLAPKYARPSVETPNAYKEFAFTNGVETNAWKIAEPRDNTLRGEWWNTFSEPALNQLEAQAGASNQTAAISFANFLAARALVKQARSQYVPLVTAAPAVTRARQSAHRGISNLAFSSGTLNDYSLPLDASWEIDFWGRVRNSVKATSLEAQAALADLENVRLTVHAEVAIDYFQIRALDAQIQLLNSAVQAYQESLSLTQVRHDTGIASDQDVAQAETQLYTTRAQSTDLGIQRAQLEHAIAILIGKAPSSFSLPVEPLNPAPASVPLDIPSHLLERRPDIAAAERRVNESNAQIGVARAAYFPSITLSGGIGYQSSSLANLVSWPSLFWSIGGTLAQTIFDGGKRKGVTGQAWAVYQGDTAKYRQTVLTGFQEVEDNLSTLRLLEKEVLEQEAAVKSSERYLTLATDRYKLGIDSYLNMITAQTTLLSNQRTAVNLRALQMTATVQLIKALGGGWDTSRLGSETTLPKTVSN